MTSALILVGKRCQKTGGMICAQNELNSILQKLTQIYRSVYGENLVQVILYGSYARGDYHTDSDVDVVAIVHGDRKTLQQQLKRYGIPLASWS